MRERVIGKIMTPLFSANQWKAIIAKPSRRDPGGTVLVTAGGDLAIDCNRSGSTFIESAANAILIAEAPAMLSAIQDLIVQLEIEGRGGGANVRKLKGIVRKATRLCIPT